MGQSVLAMQRRASACKMEIFLHFLAHCCSFNQVFCNLCLYATRGEASDGAVQVGMSGVRGSGSIQSERWAGCSRETDKERRGQKWADTFGVTLAVPLQPAQCRCDERM